jgi:hypothetical protein
MYYMEDKMRDKSNTSVVPSVAGEFCLLLLVMLFASTPFFAAQAAEKPVAAFASAGTAAKTLP